MEKGEGVPQLPRGNILSGLCAATLQYVDIRKIAYAAIVGVQMTQSPRYELVSAIGDAVLKHVSKEGLSKEKKNAIKNCIEQQYQSSADFSVYI